MTGPSDLDLLRRHEPILRFTDGELFFPMAAGSYVESCDLLTGPSLREARVAIPAGELNLERLAAVGDPPLGEAQFLRFVPKPLSALCFPRCSFGEEAGCMRSCGTAKAWASVITPAARSRSK